MRGRRAALAVAISIAVLGAAQDASPASFSPESLFECFWNQTRDHIHDEAFAQRCFGASTRDSLRALAREATDLDALARVFNDYFDRLSVSHTHLTTDGELAFHLYRGFDKPYDSDTLAVDHIGVQGESGANGFVVRNVFEGGPAHRAGLRRGDVIVSADGRPFQPFRSFASFEPGLSSLLGVRRNGRALLVRVLPVHESIHRSLLEAMKKSVRRDTIEGRRIGYLHLWTLVFPTIRAQFMRLVTDSLADCDGLVVDLRDGFGGWWFEYGDAFFANRSEYPTLTVRGRDGFENVIRADSFPPHPWFRGQVVAIVNEGSRSGKEGLAHHLKKSGRARLVGTTTAGAFRGGNFYTCAGAPDAILVVGINALWIEGVVLEGPGVAPDVVVPYPLDRSLPKDPQLERAYQEMRLLLARSKPRGAMGL